MFNSCFIYSSSDRFKVRSNSRGSFKSRLQKEEELMEREFMLNRNLNVSKIKAIKDTFYFGNSLSSKYNTGIFHLKVKDRNYVFTFTDLLGNVIRSITAGTYESKRKKRFSFTVAEVLARKLCIEAVSLGVKNLYLVFHSYNKVIQSSVVRVMKSHFLKISASWDRIPVPHNGCRGKKQRRL